ncbi:poly(A)-specific ribonuclease PNLDC1-like [Mytilus californianus]|uniref:poly(A)-specific ribonuclease PNLDC1-like n=1 Tax=Mytilus californianus TaxID=6549 RepID=UPI002245A8DD|nr:poly(A)-specific ribonuclease PNLDC1-like [Mytilus californianus]
MVGITKANFEDVFPTVETAIRKAEFIALDAEFTGLQLNKQTKSTLFDTSEERYAKLRRTISNITICQIGVSAFVKDPDSENKYIAHTFNFHLYPPVFGPVDVRFTCQASSLRFLCKYNFDFNKFIYDGISYLNAEQEQQIQQYLDRKDLFQGVERDVDESAIQKLLSTVAEWMFGTETDKPLEIVKDDEDLLYTQDYIVHSELRNRFPDIWTTIDKTKITIEKIGEEKRKALEKEEVQSKEQQATLLKNSLVGFTRVFRLLTEAKKPILGHNMLMDLLLYYDKFHKYLPRSYKEFKSEIHKLFPVIIDTKHITNFLRKPLENTGLLQSTALGSLYEAFHSQKGQQYVIHTPSIALGPGCEHYMEAEFPHEAGFDSYMCGYVFLRIAHIETFRDVLSTEVVPCSFRRYLHSTSQYVNKINIIRANLNYLSIDCEDPVSERPDLLFVRSKKKSYKLEVGQIARWFSPYGSVDISLKGPYSALVATSHFGCARDILRNFKRHEKIAVSKYSVWKHSPVVRNVFIAGTLLSGGLCAWVLWSSRKQPA